MTDMPQSTSTGIAGRGTAPSNPFTAHPHALNESYVEHMGHAMSYAGRLFAASFCAFVHGLLPFLFEKTASSLIREMYGEMTARGATTPVEATKAD